MTSGTDRGFGLACRRITGGQNGAADSIGLL
jgi:hypothetical protein